jgi:hypothetical protein
VITERQLETWASQGPTAQFTDTYNGIRNNLVDNGSPYPVANTDIFLQGSYKNNTNVYGDSDVDIVLFYSGAFYKDLSRLSPEDRQAYGYANAKVASYGYADLKRDATAYITRLYNGVSVGKKALHIPGNNSGRRNADVLIAFEFRRYHEFKSWQSQRYDEGVSFFLADGSMIENFPKLHSMNCTAKHQNTKSYFKSMVRIFKNMRNTMTERGLISDGLAPSYFIECMLYNVPDDKFGGTYQQTWINCFNYIVTADPKKFVCANYMHWLIRDGSPTSWAPSNFNNFLAALKGFWES